MSAPDRIEHNPALVPPLQPVAPKKTEQPGRTTEGATFDEILRKKVADRLETGAQTAEVVGAPLTIKFSAHAAARLQQRGISLDESQLTRLEQAFDKASAKGARDALVLLDDTAMVASIKNRTVTTALSREQARDNVFTNIDSAVIA